MNFDQAGIERNGQWRHGKLLAVGFPLWLSRSSFDAVGFSEIQLFRCFERLDRFQEGGGSCYL